jgi:hypothetical protein
LINPKVTRESPKTNISAVGKTSKLARPGKMPGKKPGKKPGRKPGKKARDIKIQNYG